MGSFLPTQSHFPLRNTLGAGSSSSFFLIENDELRSSGENRRMVVWDVKLNYDLLDFFLYFQFFPFILSIYALESRSQSYSSCLVFGGYGDNCIFGRGHVTSYRIHFFKNWNCFQLIQLILWKESKIFMSFFYKRKEMFKDLPFLTAKRKLLIRQCWQYCYALFSRLNFGITFLEHCGSRWSISGASYLSRLISKEKYKKKLQL